MAAVTASLAALRPARLGEAFYEAPVIRLARECIGKVLVVASASGVVAGRIVETEAYRGPNDLAAHTAGGRRTQRTEAMFGPAGTIYMFRLYGMHWAFNIVAGPIDTPHAILVRALEPVLGIETMVKRRGGTRLRNLASGPGKVCAAMGLDGGHYGQSLLSGNVFLSDGPPVATARTERINIDYAGAWADKPWRFVERGSPWLSRRD